MEKVYITGDVHRMLSIKKFSETNFPEQKGLTKDDYMVIAGDFGAIWYGGGTDKQVLDIYDAMPFTTLFIDGNHENFNILDAYPITMWHGGKVQRITESVIHLMRGQVYNIAGKTFFTFGGGTSFDKAMRIEGISWWPQELPSRKETEEALDNLEAVGNRVDYMVTHAGPRDKKAWKGIFEKLYDVKCPAEDFLNELIKKVDYKEWYCGHYHMDREVPAQRLRLLYNDIARLI